MGLIVEELHGFASLQGLPKFGWQRFGVPSGGAADLASAALANHVCGNFPHAPVLEFALARAVLRAERDLLVAFTGAVGSVTWECLPAKSHSPIWMQPGQRLIIAVPSQGVYSYLAVRGGFANDELITARLGPDARLAIGTDMDSEPTSVARPPDHGNARIEIVLGSQAAMFHLPTLFGQRFEVTRTINRQGIRLQGFALTGGAEITSEPCCPGAIQVTRNGQLIVVGPDGPTIGGYPKIGVVTREGLNLLAQRRPGQKVQFEMAR